MTPNEKLIDDVTDFLYKNRDKFYITTSMGICNPLREDILNFMDFYYVVNNEFSKSIISKLEFISISFNKKMFIDAASEYFILQFTIKSKILYSNHLLFRTSFTI